MKRQRRWRKSPLFGLGGETGSSMSTRRARSTKPRHRRSSSKGTSGRPRRRAPENPHEEVRMTIDSLGDLWAALARGDLDRLNGTAECEWLDFKLSPYAVSEEYGKWELAKDVAGFANAAGGVIVVGFETEKRPNEAREVA